MKYLLLAALLIILGISAWTARSEGEIREWEDETEAWIDQGKG
jgi:hypothetical protein